MIESSISIITVIIANSAMGEASLPKELQGLGMTVRNNIYSIMSAVAKGDL